MSELPNMPQREIPQDEIESKDMQNNGDEIDD